MYPAGGGYGFPNGPGPGMQHFNNAAPPQHQQPNLHIQQPGQIPQGQPGPQQMMYNPQQFAAMGGQAPFVPGAPNPAMMSGPGPAGMMQNPAMPHMGGAGQSKSFASLCKLLTVSPPCLSFPFSAFQPSSGLSLRLSSSLSRHVARDATIGTARALHDTVRPD